MKLSIKDFCSKCDQIRSSFLPIWSPLLKKSLVENFIFCAVHQIRKRLTKGLKSQSSVTLISFLFFVRPALPFCGSPFLGAAVMVCVVYWTNSKSLRRKVDYNPIWRLFIWWLQYAVFNFRTEHLKVFRDGAFFPLYRHIL